MDPAKRLKEREKEKARLKWRGISEHIRSDNGPEFLAQQLRQWLGKLGTGTLYIEPGSPWENGYCERTQKTRSTPHLPRIL